MMVEIDKYLCDGADWQSRAVLAYLQGHWEGILREVYAGNFQYDAQIRVGRYENGRENGYSVSVMYMWQKQKTFAFYEHRNSDNIYVLHTDDYFGFETPYSENIYKNYKDKWDCDKSFKVGEIVECGEYIAEEIKKFLAECKTQKELNW